MISKHTLDSARTHDRTWLDADSWRKVQASVPIACVDVLPLRTVGGRLTQLGLILRDTPNQGLRWCLIGGRLLWDESFVEAVRRQVRDALGPVVTARVDDDAHPIYVAQYFTIPRETGSFDPRQHAIGLIFRVMLDGDPEPQGEALEFRWFQRNTLPLAHELGFGQDRIIAACLERLDEIHSPRQQS